MLEVQHRKGRKINRVYQEGKALYLEQESGLIRILPQTDRIIRVSYTENGGFASEQGAQLADLSLDGGSFWSWKEEEKEIRVDTGYLRMRIARGTGSISYERADGSLLLAERDRESKCVEAFDSYRMVVNENTQIEEIQTPDGIKRRIREADRVFDKKLYHTRLHLDFAPEEHLYGLGQAEEGVWNLRHTTQYLHQANLKIAVPMLLSDKGYGILLSTQSPAIFNDTQYGTYLYTEADEYLDYYFLAGECADEVTGGFRMLTGKAAMLPRWAFGYIQSQERYESAVELVETAKRFRQEEIPLDALVLDWMSWKGNLWGQKTFDGERFPDPADMIQKLHEQKVHFMISIWPNMSELSDNYQNFWKGLLLPASEIYDAFSRKAAVVREQAERGCSDMEWTPGGAIQRAGHTGMGRRCKPEPGEMYRPCELLAMHAPPEATPTDCITPARSMKGSAPAQRKKSG
ncbi:MAG: TIM-barrel domain-containing protein [Eisenbergiella massiliensis]